MKKAILFTALLISSISLQATELHNTPPYQTETRNVGSYDEVHVGGWFDVVLVSGKEGQITLKGKESVLEHITTEVKNGNLKIQWDNDKSWNPFQTMSSVEITVPVEDLEGVALAGSGSISSETSLKATAFKTTLAGSGEIELELVAQKLSSTISGSGTIELHGNTSEYEIQVSGSGDIKAFDMKADDVSASVSGSADVEVYAKNSITARISGSGDVEYRGEATKIDSKVSGSGSVRKG